MTRRAVAEIAERFEANQGRRQGIVWVTPSQARAGVKNFGRRLKWNERRE